MRICPSCSLKTEATTCPEDGSQTVEFGQYQAVQNDPFVGQVFEDRYRIDGVLGTGGFGTVYRGEQLAVGRPVAIKLLHAQYADDLKEVARFQREARSIAALRHPNIVQLYDFGQTKDGYLYLVMECLEGRTLKHIVRGEAPIEPERIIDYLVQVLDGLAEAHANGVVHRDLKPENVFCASIGRREDVIKILDFGIAKIIDESGSATTLTGKGMAVGSPRYMSPEQARAKTVTAQTDLYLFGLIFYELLTGRPVFERGSPTDYLLAHIRDSPPPPTANGAVLTGPLVELLMQCLAKDPDDRPESAEALMGALEACRGRGLHELGTVTSPIAVTADETITLSRGNPKNTPALPVAPPSSPSKRPPPPPPSMPPAAPRGRPPAPSTFERLPAPPPPPRGGPVGPVGASPAPWVVAGAVVAFALFVLGAVVYFGVASPSPPPTAVNVEVEGGIEAAAVIADDVLSATPDGAATEDGSADMSADDDDDDDVRPCKTSRDCEADETCIDGVCEAD